MIEKWLKNGAFMIMCGLLTFAYFKTKETPVVDKEVVVTSYDDYCQVVYMDDDHLLIPVTYKVQATDDLTSQVQEIFTLMKDPGQLKNELQTIIPENTSLLSTELVDGQLTLNFDQGLSNLTTDNELRFLEALGYVFTQIDGVDHVQIAMDGEVLQQLPQGKIQLADNINAQLGINNFESSTKDLHHTVPMMVFLAKTIGDEEFYVPISKRVSANESLDAKLEEIIGEVSVSSTLKQASSLETLSLLDGSSLENGHLSVNLNAMALLDETTLDQEVYDLLLLSLGSMNGVEEITIQVQGEDIETPATKKVSDIIYNVVKI